MKTKLYSLAMAAILSMSLGFTFGTASSAQASSPAVQRQQRGMRGGMRGGMMGGDYVANPSSLLRRDDVKKDIKLTADQQSKLDQIQQDMMNSFRNRRQSGQDQQGGQGSQNGRQDFEKAMKDYNTKVNAVLTPDQQARLKQIAIQLMGNRAITDKTVQTDLKVTDAQKTKIDSLQKGYDDAMTQVFQKVRDGDMQFSDVKTYQDKNQKALDDELGKVLTADQKAQLAQMAGPKFTATDKEPSFGGRRGGGRGGPGGGGPGGGGPGGPGGGGPGGGSNS